jgi:putative N6-adenine-specific DNA methylase
VQAASGGAGFDGSLATAYAVNLHSRLASRVLWRLAGGAYRDESDLYQVARAVAWEAHFKPSQTLRVDVTATRSPLRSLQFATLKIKDAIADQMRDRCGERPSVDRSSPDVQVVAHLDAHSADLYLDLSGEPLFKRGWRVEKGEAPLKENLPCMTRFAAARRSRSRLPASRRGAHRDWRAILRSKSCSGSMRRAGATSWARRGRQSMSAPSFISPGATSRPA